MGYSTNHNSCIFVTFVNAYNFIDGVDGLALTETVRT